MTRVIKFGVVGVACLLVHIMILQVLKDFIPVYAANWLGFLVSAQLNFFLSYAFTWRDSKRRHGAQLAYTWMRFNGVVLVSSIINAVAFVFALRIVGLVDYLAVVMAVAISTVVTFLLNHFLVLKPEPQGTDQEVIAKADPANVILSSPTVTGRPGIAFFMPAWNEADNLPYVVGDAVSYLRQHVDDFVVIVVDDGSTDDTVDVVKQLMHAFPGYVQLVCHDVNQGYGAALRTGFNAALETEFVWTGFCDADGQFRPEDVGRLIESAVINDAQVAIGHRKVRADNMKRRLMGRGWHVLSRMLLGFSATDVDCGFKLFRRDALLTIAPRLSGEHATISPEILARARLANQKIVEIPIDHYARERGTQTGANLTVILESLKGLVSIRQAIRKEESHGDIYHEHRLPR